MKLDAAASAFSLSMSAATVPSVFSAFFTGFAAIWFLERHRLCALRRQQMAPLQKQAPPPATLPQAAPAPELKQIGAPTSELCHGAKGTWTEVTDKILDNAPPIPKIDAKLDDVAKKYGFANYPDHNTVIDNSSLCSGGIDPATKKYVGTETVVKAQIAQVTADKKMPAKGQEGSACRPTRR